MFCWNEVSIDLTYAENMLNTHIKKVWMLGCPRNSDTEPWHRAQSLSHYASHVDIEYLRALVSHATEEPNKPPPQECTYVCPATS